MFEHSQKLAYPALYYSSMNQAIELSILIPTHSRCQTLTNTLQCLQALPGPSREIIVIDDASNDGTAQMLRTFPEVRVLHNSTPKGFDSLPDAISMARGKLILQLDDDAYPSETTLDQIVSHFQNRGAKLGLVALPFQKPTSKRLSYTTYFPKVQPEQSYVPTRGFHAGAVVARREACLKIPLSPPHYFMYGTEIPTVIEFLNHGWEADYLPSAPIIHHWAARRGNGISQRAAYYPLRNDLITIQRYYRGWRRWEMLIGRYITGFFHLTAAGQPLDLFRASKSASQLLKQEGLRQVSEDILKHIYPAFEGLTLTTFFSEANLRRVGWFLGLVPIDQTC